VDNPNPENTLRVRTLTLDHFRNYESLELSLSEGIHILAGQNAQGKTNLLEALYLLSSTRLLRGMKDTEAIMAGADRASATAELEPSGTQVSVVLERSARKKVLLNGMGLPRASDVLGRLPCVCISSADLPIVSGEPSDRRLFLDLELSQLYPAYLRHLAVYKRAVEQRNSLLKAAQSSYVSDELFESWEAQMAQHGAELRAFRMRLLDLLTPYAQAAHHHMGSGESLSLGYLPKDEFLSGEQLGEGLQSTRRGDIARGSTSIGPHRDDFRIEVADREARIFGSQGQQRTAMVSIKLGTMELEREERGFAPLLLLDDILSDLDESRRAHLMDWVLSNASQTVLTCTESSAAGPAILSNARIFHVSAGTICEG
jgi:DNA replication and repair protein RecF